MIEDFVLREARIARFYTQALNANPKPAERRETVEFMGATVARLMWWHYALSSCYVGSEDDVYILSRVMFRLAKEFLPEE